MMQQLICDMYDDIFGTGPCHNTERRVVAGFLALTMVIALGMLIAVLVSATSTFLGH